MALSKPDQIKANRVWVAEGERLRKELRETLKTAIRILSIKWSDMLAALIFEFIDQAMLQGYDLEASIEKLAETINSEYGIDHFDVLSMELEMLNRKE